MKGFVNPSGGVTTEIRQLLVDGVRGTPHFMPPIDRGKLVFWVKLVYYSYQFAGLGKIFKNMQDKIQRYSFFQNI